MTHIRVSMAQSGSKLLACAALLCGLTPLSGASVQPATGRLVTTTYVDNYGGLFEFNTDDSNAVSLTPYSLQGARGQDGTPSVSGNGKLIAFSSARNATNQGERHIWLMNGDGTNPHPLTTGGVLASGDVITDTYPTISPDGTKIAFISNRFVYTFPSGFPYNGIKVAFHDVYVINTDGTGLHQVTQTEPNTSGSGSNGSDVLSVAWGPDSNRLVFRGYRQTTVNGQAGYHAGLFFINADGSGEANFQVLDSTGQWGAVDWSPNGRYITTPYGGEAQGAPPYRIFIFDLQSGSTQTLSNLPANVETGAPGTIRFSPDSNRVVYLTTNDFVTDHPTISNLDGTGVTTLMTELGRFTWLWWQGGTAIPTPTRLTLSSNIPPDLLLLFTGQAGVPVTPTLYDAQGNVIVHAVGSWNPGDSRYFTLDAQGVATPTRTQDTGPLTLTASNGGVASSPEKVLINLPNVSIKVDQLFNYFGATQSRIAITNSGAGGATGIRITSLTLDGATANESLPFNYGNVPAGSQSQDLAFSFPISSKPSGTTVLLKVKGAYDYYGTFNTTVRVQLP